MANPKGNTQSLKPFKKGKDPRRQIRSSPNPIVTDIKNYIREKLSEETLLGSGISKLEAITQKIIKKAFDGDVRAWELAMAYGYGKPSQSIDVTSKGEALNQTIIIQPYGLATLPQSESEVDITKDGANP